VTVLASCVCCSGFVLVFSNHSFFAVAIQGEAMALCSTSTAAGCSCTVRCAVVGRHTVGSQVSSWTTASWSQR
jgi:hypothetical protein